MMTSSIVQLTVWADDERYNEITSRVIAMCGKKAFVPIFDDTNLDFLGYHFLVPTSLFNILAKELDIRDGKNEIVQY